MDMHFVTTNVTLNLYVWCIFSIYVTCMHVLMLSNYASLKVLVVISSYWSTADFLLTHHLITFVRDFDTWMWKEHWTSESWTSALCSVYWHEVGSPWLGMFAFPLSGLASFSSVISRIGFFKQSRHCDHIPLQLNKKEGGNGRKESNMIFQSNFCILIGKQSKI